jgi:AraC-like DNA-binding protein
MHHSLKRRLAVLVAVLAAVAFAGGAYAATQSSPTNIRQAFLEDVAHRLNVTPATLRAAFKGAYLDQLNAAVASGRLTKAQAAALRKWVQRTGAIPLGALRGAGFAPPVRPWIVPRFAAPGGFMPFRRAGLFGGLLASASYLAISPMQLREQLDAGKSLAQVAAARGKSASGLTAALLARARAMVSGLVAAKVITAARGKRLLARLSARIDKLINRTGLGFFPFAPPLRPGIARAVPVP